MPFGFNVGGGRVGGKPRTERARPTARSPPRSEGSTTADGVPARAAWGMMEGSKEREIPMADASPKQILEETIPSRLESRPGLAEEIGAVVVFRITGAAGGDWTLDCSSGNKSVRAGAVPSPQMTITATDSDFVQVATGKLDPSMAAMSGKLKLSPMDMALGLKLVKLLS